MTEQEYIYTSDLQRIKNAREIIEQLIPEIDDQVFLDERRQTIKILQSWEKRLGGRIRIEAVKEAPHAETN